MLLLLLLLLLLPPPPPPPPPPLLRLLLCGMGASFMGRCYFWQDPPGFFSGAKKRKLYSDANGHFLLCHALSLSSVFCYRAGSGYPNGYPVLGNSQDGFPLPSLWFVITYCDQSFSFLGTVCPRHPPYPVLPSCPLSRALPYPQPGDASGCHSAPAICQSLTSADLMLTLRNLPMEIGEIIGIYVTEVVFTNARLGFGGTIRNFLQGEVASLFLSIEFRHGCRIFMYTRYCVILQMCTR